MIEHVSILLPISCCKLLRDGKDVESAKVEVRLGMKAMSCLDACFNTSDYMAIVAPSSSSSQAGKLSSTQPPLLQLDLSSRYRYISYRCNGTKYEYISYRCTGTKHTGVNQYAIFSHRYRKLWTARSRPCRVRFQQ